MAHYEREKDSTLSPGCLAIEFIKKRYIRMFPEYALAFLILAAYNVFALGKDIYHIMIKGFWEFFMLNSIGMELHVNGISWYASVLIVASYCVYFMLHKFKDTYIYFLAPLIFGIIYVCIYRNIGYIDVVQSRHFIIWDGLWRGIAEINLGIISYKIYIKYKNVLAERLRWFTSVAEIFLLTFITAIMWRTRHDEKDFIIAVLIALFIIIVASNGGILSNLLNNKISIFLGSISYSMYIHQNIFVKVPKQFFLGHSYWLTACIVILLWIIFAIMSYYFIKKLIIITINSDNNYM